MFTNVYLLGDDCASCMCHHLGLVQRPTKALYQGLLRVSCRSWELECDGKWQMVSLRMDAISSLFAEFADDFLRIKGM